jgi:ABC-2 type transport system permease protein
MIHDLAAMIWKEWRELVFLRNGKVSLLILLGVFGVLMPLQSGQAWLRSPVNVVYWIWVPLMQVATLIADSFVGEKERHTLETLLASRLPGPAILFGKAAVAIGYGWGLMIAILLSGAATVNLADPGRGLIFYPWEIVVPLLAFGLAGAGLIAGIAILISMRFSTVRQAVQMMNLGILILIWLPLLGLQALPDSVRSQFALGLPELDPTVILVLLFLFIIALDVALFAWAARRFQREKLILNT